MGVHRYHDLLLIAGQTYQLKNVKYMSLFFFNPQTNEQKLNGFNPCSLTVADI